VFLVEDGVRENGGDCSKGTDWQYHVVVDDLLITEQNPASSKKATRALLKKLGGTARPKPS
jgi:putative intracellular protease/amidase